MRLRNSRITLPCEKTPREVLDALKELTRENWGEWVKVHLRVLRVDEFALEGYWAGGLMRPTFHGVIKPDGVMDLEVEVQFYKNPMLMTALLLAAEALGPFSPAVIRKWLMVAGLFLAAFVAVSLLHYSYFRRTGLQIIQEAVGVGEKAGRN